MKIKGKLITAYLIIAVIYAVSATYFVDHAHRGFAYNLGQGIVWPVFVFPTLGGIVTAIIVVVFVALLMIL